MAVILRDIQDKSYEEAAEILDLPLGTVKSRINRGRLQLAKILKDRKEGTHDL
jgi:RNA polymerase sigma-70 factor (ECF subfamily)